MGNSIFLYAFHKDKSLSRGLAGPGTVHSILIFKEAALFRVITLCLCMCNEH